MINKLIDDESVLLCKKMIEQHDNIVIICHMSPDGDAIGSSLGLYHFLDRLGKNATVVVPDLFPQNLQFLKGSREIVVYTRYPEFAESLIEKADLIFCLDFNALHRIDRLQKALSISQAKKILIDHHLSPEAFCDLTISYPKIASTCELLFRLICSMGMLNVLNTSAAECIYTGMMTDTGNFTYNSNSPEMYIIVSELLKKGVDKDRIYSLVCNTNSADKVRLNGFAVSQRMELLPEDRAAIICLSQEDLKLYDYHKGDSEGLVNVPLGIQGYVVSVFFREDKEHIKVSLRSKGNYPVNRIASECFGGGGHLNAAGGEFHGTMEEAQRIFKEALPGFDSYIMDKK